LHKDVVDGEPLEFGGDCVGDLVIESGQCLLDTAADRTPWVGSVQPEYRLAALEESPDLLEGDVPGVATQFPTPVLARV